MSADASDGLSDALNDLAKEPDDKIYAEPVEEEEEASKEESMQEAFGLTDNIVAEVEEEAPEVADQDEAEAEPEPEPEPEPESQPEDAPAPQTAAPAPTAARTGRAGKSRPVMRRPKRPANTELKSFLFPVLGTLGLLLTVVGVLSIAGIGPGGTAIDPTTGQPSSGAFGILLGVASFITALLLMARSVMMGVQVVKERAQQKAEKAARGR